MNKRKLAACGPALALLTVMVVTQGIGLASSPVAVSLNSTTGTLNPSQIQSFTATVTGSTNTGVTWALNPNVGSLATGGNTVVYIAPVIINAAQTVTITATAMASPTTKASALISLLPLVTMALTPTSVSLGSSGAQQFTAAVTGTTNTGVTWSVQPAVGTISSTGFYQAPSSIEVAQDVTITGTSKANPAISTNSRVTLNRATPLIYCNFSSAATPCVGSNYSLNGAITLDPSGVTNNGLRICKGTGCPTVGSVSSIRFKGQALSVRRGTIAFWIKQNNNSPMTGSEIFNTYPGDPYVSGGFTASVSKNVTAVVHGAATVLVVPNHGLASGALVRVGGGTGIWSGINRDWIVTVIDANNVSIPLDSSYLGVFNGSASLLTAGSVAVSHTTLSGYNYGVFPTDKFVMAAGEWHHIVWTWTADRHSIYRDGILVGTFDSTSPFPYVSTFPSLGVGMQQGGTQDITIDEFGSYPYAFSAQEVTALYNEAVPSAASPARVHGVSALVTWGPGEQKAKVSLDAGDFSAQVQSFRADVYCNGSIVASQDFSQVNGGFAEGLISLPSFPTGQYYVIGTAYGSPGIVGTATSDVYQFTQPAWLGNSYGIDTSVPATYFSPITANGTNNLNLNVINRTYALGGGYGLPTQITSLGQAQLSSPVSLSFMQGGAALALSNTTVAVTNIQPNTATWQGSAVAGSSVSVSVTGTLDYDGMVLLKLHIAPTAGPVQLDGIQLQTNLTSSAAKYIFAVKDQPYWWYVWSVRPPQVSGEFNNNLSTTPRAAYTNNIFSVVLSDDDRGLEIFHNNMAGWQINESIPWQRFIRGTNGAVTYEADLANQSFTLSQPMDITVGYMATPAKSLPASWRLATGGAGYQNAPSAPLQYQFDFTLGNTWSTFSLFPTNLGTYKAGSANGIRSQGKLDLPFVNAHVLAPYSAEMSTIQAETLNDNWNSSPSRGEGDYWAWSMNHLLNDPTTSNVVDGYYIDESYGYLANASLLTGAGYIKPDGSHGIGLNLLGARANFNRLAKILIAAGKTPNLWMHTTAYSAPHMYSHAMMTFDGERPNSGVTYYVDATSGTTPDHFDIWNNNNSILDPTQAGNGSWLLSTAQTRKFGFIPNMWSGIQCCNLPYFQQKQRAAECLYQMNDMLQQDQTLAWWQPKANFGLDQPDVVFHGYLTQQEIQATDPKVKVTYYQRNNSLLAYIANFNSTDWSGSVSFTNVAGVPSTAFDAETGSSLAVTSSVLNISVSHHNCRIVQFGH